MAKKLKIKVKVIPSSGEPVEHSVKVSASGASVKEILAQAKLDPKNSDFTVNGNVANLDTHVSESDILQAKATVSVSQRPQSS